MALVNSLLNTFTKAIEVADSVHAVEKSKMQGVKDQADEIFKV